MNNTQLVVSGSIAVDRLMNFPGHYRDFIEPGKIDILSVSVLVDSLDEAEGGTGANIAHYWSCLGETPVLLASAGVSIKPYLARLEASGVDVSNVHMSKLATASFSVLTDVDGNQVGGFYPGAMADADGLSFAPWAGEDVIACVSAHDPIAMRRQTEECAQHNIRLVYDPGQQVSNISGEDLIVGVDAAEVLIVNEYELNLLLKKTGQSQEELQTKVPVLIVTHGEHGSIISGSNNPKQIKVKSVAPDQIIDPTGAGDAYRAGSLYGYLRQWDMLNCGRLGSVIASFALEQHGPQAKITQDMIVKRYNQAFNQEIIL